VLLIELTSRDSGRRPRLLGVVDMTYAVLALLYTNGPLLVRRFSAAAQNNTLLIVVTAVVFVKSIIYTGCRVRV